MSCYACKASQSHVIFLVTANVAVHSTCEGVVGPGLAGVLKQPCALVLMKAGNVV
jgi:hypothetical protein